MQLEMCDMLFIHTLSSAVANVGVATSKQTLMPVSALTFTLRLTNWSCSGPVEKSIEFKGELTSHVTLVRI